MSPLGRPLEPPFSLDFNGFGDDEGILKFAAQVSDGTIHLRVV